MSTLQSLSEEQSRLWNGAGGQAWVDSQALLDELFAPFEPVLIDGLQAHERVLDIGCGTGATTLAAARRQDADCVGVDVSAPMLALAQARSEREGSQARFVCADAQSHVFDPASFDRLISRFGVMFFADPQAAFANLRRAASDGAKLRLIVWRSAAENPFMTLAERTAAPWLPQLPVRRPGSPGQFAFAETQRVRELLAASGWGGVEISPLDVPLSMPESALVPYLSRLGPVGIALQELEEGARAALVERLCGAFAPFVRGGRVEFEAACWMIEAQAAP
ncbi:class I SAM-dependent methyltransferase [Pseudomonas sp. PDM15]|uniref:class I SAM-dependent methyltransferase n=1 Tax=Pseudomonas sp. PDM15 TaxID=2769303 RepID=UPI00177C322B|nr:class I SAM-dependent methyltransferase [Pseudomonas sp. PDM15]MBD9424719.1 class I SAM-dependent methyltransferase [Pseudomonas sp. PDM15]